MGARFLQETFRPETAFEYFMGESKKAIQNLSNGLSDRFINRLESNTELNVCVWDTKDEFTVGSSDELPNKNVKGKNFEWRIEKVWDDEHPSWHRSLVAPFSYVSQDDESVKEFLQNDNLYFCVVGMKINWNDYLERSPHRDYTILLMLYVVVPYLRA
ncbi:hypothetical protein FOXB_17012 [Fusarium oxysporum f. sp. conglutinans Fo5176]|uniref:Uncharacterized protein n=1 Tax=Fusarium oxysporum (strain Fo5176) TaxID=660025 RepID=F9GEC8_FUSOF|nr:hypothetical protein FOXB_17012 [Fusarium oxysporum f. sp. conglutinans Fo5176]